MNPNYPVFVISKGRADSRYTIKALQAINVPFWLIIEPQELKQYREHVAEAQIITTPFWNLGQGSIPARNFVWQLAHEKKESRYWLLDDNILGFERLNRNERATVTSGTIFRVAEIFCDRYENVALAGFEYRQFSGGARRVKPPFRLNTRIYSCTLIKTDLTHRWRGRYNEDTDLSLRVLKDGWCTVLFHCFLQNKAGTMTMKGGNTDEIYSDKKRLDFAQSLANQHPDVAAVVERYGRYHHDVNYEVFRRNKLIFREGVQVKKGVNEYGMKLVKR